MRARIVLPVLLLATAAAGCVSAETALAASPAVPAPALDQPKAAAPGKKTAVFAGGCFWCVEAVFEAVDGVLTVESGYAGDVEAKARYALVGGGDTKHAEAVQITYDPSKVTYGQLLQVLFLTSEPTVKDKQGPDAGHQYRMAVFFADEEERKIAAAYVAQLDAAKLYDKPIVTTLEKLERFYPAEAYHQDFVRLHPNHPYVRAWSIPKLQKLLRMLPERVKAS